MAEMVRDPIILTPLDRTIREEVDKYIAHSDTSVFLAVHDDEQKLYAVISVPHLPRPWPSRVVVMAQVHDEYVVIIEDITDKPLYEALVANGGVPREKIILAYRGETLPEQTA
jgi:hypothetical protein